MVAAIWFSVLLLCLILYVVLDGYDLGIGVNLLVERDRARQREMVEIVATAWDGNESWIILLGVGLWAGFPRAEAVILPHVYIPFVVMLFAIVLRGVSIELISGSKGTPRRWLAAFGVGSLVAAFAQGMIFGALTQSVAVEDGRYAGGPLDFFSAYSVLTGLATVLLYSALGSSYLRYKSDGELQARSARRGRVFIGFLLAATLFCVLSLNATAAPISLDNGAIATVFVAMVVLAFAAMITALVRLAIPPHGSRSDTLPFAALTVATVLGLLGYALARQPVILPPAITLQSAQAPPETLSFVLIGLGANIPLVLFYNWYAHHVFRGKYRVAAGERPPGRSATSLALSGKGGRTRGSV